MRMFAETYMEAEVRVSMEAEVSMSQTLRQVNEWIQEGGMKDINECQESG